MAFEIENAGESAGKSIGHIAKKKPLIIFIGIGAAVAIIVLIKNRLSGVSSAQPVVTSPAPSAPNYPTSSADYSGAINSLSDNTNSAITKMSEAMSAQNDNINATLTTYSQNTATEIAAIQDNVTQSASKNTDTFNTLNSEISSLSNTVIGLAKNQSQNSSPLVQNYTPGQVGNYSIVPQGNSASDIAAALHQQQVGASQRIVALQEQYVTAQKAGIGVDTLNKIHQQADAIGYEAGLQTTLSTKTGSERKLVLA